MCGWRSGRESEYNKDRHLNRTVYSGHGKRGRTNDGSISAPGEKRGRK